MKQPKPKKLKRPRPHDSDSDFSLPATPKRQKIEAVLCNPVNAPLKLEKTEQEASESSEWETVQTEFVTLDCSFVTLRH